MADDTIGQSWRIDPGRIRLARLNRHVDLLAAIESLCRKDGLDTVLFTVTGSITGAVFGVYDPCQQVYVTEQIEQPMTLVACTGNLVRNGARYWVQAHGTAADLDGRVHAGRLFSPTPVVAAEAVLQELSGHRLQRSYDENTGLRLWSRQKRD